MTEIANMIDTHQARGGYAPSDIDSDFYEDAVSVRSLTHRPASVRAASIHSRRTTYLGQSVLDSNFMDNSESDSDDEALAQAEHKADAAAMAAGLVDINVDDTDDANEEHDEHDDNDDGEDTADEHNTDKTTLTSAHGSISSSPDASKRSSNASSIDSKEKHRLAMGQQPQLVVAIPMPMPTVALSVTSPVGNMRPITPMLSMFDHSLNDMVNLDNVCLDDDAAPPLVPDKEPSPVLETASEPLRLPEPTEVIITEPEPEIEVEAPPPPPKEPTPPAPVPKVTRKLSLSSLTSALPSLPWSPAASDTSAKTPVPSPKVAPAPAPTPTPPPVVNKPPVRRLTSPFSWLSRSSSRERDPSTMASAVAAKDTRARRNTGGSIMTTNSNSNSEMMLQRLEEEDDSDDEIHNPHRASLKDRFKALRLKEESGALDFEDYHGHASIIMEDPESLGKHSVTNTDHSLAPGTVSGILAGPAVTETSEVDWDLWQNVVCDGPAAVARSSAEELNDAIAKGIPHAIRGVIWQVLAQSKNEDLELKYRELVARGTDKEVKGIPGELLSGNSSLTTLTDNLESSASSMHSALSGAPAGTVSPVPSGLDEASMKALAAAAEEKANKQKEDAINLQKLEKVIRRDMGARTSYSKYAAAQGLQEGLFGVCKAYALFDEAVSYAQGMNFIIMPLLFNMPEDEAFCLLVRLMNHYHLRDLFVQDMPGLHMRLYQFERLLEDLEPRLYCHLHRRGISPHLYATQWFLTLFAYRFPLQLVVRIYDLILSEGLSAILRFGIVLMQKNAESLLAMSDMQQLTVFLRDRLFDVYIDKDPSAGGILENGFFGSSSSSLDKEVYRADQLVRDACDIKMTPELLKSYTAEWEEKSKAEKEREEEIETLRTSNANLTQRLRKMEERLQVSDNEQTAMANELVHTKVENEELRDQNESLQGQVRELRIVIEKQPEEIEKTWNLERDDLMKRNLKVHQENEKLEAELTALEEELVQTKLKYAEINSQHETLNRRWTDLKKQFTIREL